MEIQQIKYLNKNVYLRELGEAVKKCSSMFGLKIEGDAAQVLNDLADFIMELNPKATMEDIRRAFRNAAKGGSGAVYKLTTVVLYGFVKDYFGAQAQRVNVHNYDDEVFVERDRLQDAKSFMRHMYDFHTSGRRIFGGWHYAYDTMLGHGWLKDEDLAAEMDNAYETLKENLQQQKYMNPHQRHSIDREIAELADYSNKTLQDKAKEIACRKVFDYWKEQGVTPDAVYANVNKVCY